MSERSKEIDKQYILGQYIEYRKLSKDATLNMTPFVLFLGIGASMACYSVTGNTDEKTAITYLIACGVLTTLSLPLAVESVKISRKLEDKASEILASEERKVDSKVDAKTRVDKIVDIVESIMPGSTQIDDYTMKMVDRIQGTSKTLEAEIKAGEKDIVKGFNEAKRTVLSAYGLDADQKREYYRIAMEISNEAWKQVLKDPSTNSRRVQVARKVIEETNRRLHKTHPLNKNIDWDQL